MLLEVPASRYDYMMPELFNKKKEGFNLKK